MLNAMIMAFLTTFESGMFSLCDSSRARSRVPRTPLARCAQTESAEIRSRRSASRWISCNSACGFGIYEEECPRCGSNAQPPDSKSVTLSIELRGQYVECLQYVKSVQALRSIGPLFCPISPCIHYIKCFPWMRNSEASWNVFSTT